MRARKVIVKLTRWLRRRWMSKRRREPGTEETSRVWLYRPNWHNSFFSGVINHVLIEATFGAVVLLLLHGCGWRNVRCTPPLCRTREFACVCVYGWMKARACLRVCVLERKKEKRIRGNVNLKLSARRKHTHTSLYERSTSFHPRHPPDLSPHSVSYTPICRPLRLSTAVLTQFLAYVWWVVEAGRVGGCEWTNSSRLHAVARAENQTLHSPYSATMAVWSVRHEALAADTRGPYGVEVNAGCMYTVCWQQLQEQRISLSSNNVIDLRPQCIYGLPQRCYCVYTLSNGKCSSVTLKENNMVRAGVSLGEWKRNRKTGDTREIGDKRNEERVGGWIYSC